MKKALLALFAASAFTMSAFAAEDTYSVDPHHTWPYFEVTHLGYSTQHGRFAKTSGTVKLDMAAKKGSVDLNIDATSLDMGFPLWNEHLSAEGFFDLAKYKSITFKSDKLIFSGDKVVAAEGEFTLLGVTKPLKIEVHNFKCGEHPMMKGKQMCGANITGVVKRSEFGMTKYLPAIGDDVRIEVPIEVIKN